AVAGVLSSPKPRRRRRFAGARRSARAVSERGRSLAYLSRGARPPGARRPVSRSTPPPHAGARMARPSRNRPPQTRRALRATAALDAPSLHVPVEGHANPRPAYSGTLPAEVSRRAQREMDRLRRLPTGSPEAAQVRAYLQWLWSTPWESLAGEDA